jgi:hypothetical protein
MLAEVLMLKVSTPQKQPVTNTATGISAFSICMKAIDRYM